MEAVTLAHDTDSVTLSLNDLYAFFEALSGTEKTAFIQMINEFRINDAPRLQQQQQQQQFSPLQQQPYFEYPSPPYVLNSPPADAAAPFTPLSRFSFVREDIEAMESESEAQQD